MLRGKDYFSVQDNPSKAAQIVLELIRSNNTNKRRSTGSKGMARGNVDLDPDIEFFTPWPTRESIYFNEFFRSNDRAQLIFSHLKDNDVKRLINNMATLKALFGL